MTVLARLVLDAALDTDVDEQRWDLGDTATIGRSPDATVSLHVAAVSRDHATIQRRGNDFWLEDNASSNGTFHRGARLGSEAVRLADGDLIVVAGAVTLRFEDLLATPIAPAIGRLHGLWIDPDSRAVWIDARRIDPPLSERQLCLLELLYTHAGDIVSRADAVDHVWSDVAAAGVTDDALAALIKRVRSRLKPYESGRPHIEIIKSRGIRLATHW